MGGGGRNRRGALVGKRSGFSISGANRMVGTLRRRVTFRTAVDAEKNGVRKNLHSFTAKLYREADRGFPSKISAGDHFRVSNPYSNLQTLQINQIFSAVAGPGAQRVHRNNGGGSNVVLLGAWRNGAKPLTPIPYSPFPIGEEGASRGERGGAWRAWLYDKERRGSNA